MGSAQDDVVPHIIIRSPRLRSGKIVFGDAKRLLQHYRHETDMPTALRNVRYWVNSGKHMLALSFSGFDPTATLAALNGNTLDAGFSPIKVLALAAKMRSPEVGI
jgi:hypothetical protein